ncbi:gluconate 2-dehydrogenase subunit 3 family protein [Luteithermobacter gelatinilyticus]|uniref:gluconate 2-dehydrogenase subunit 3 family protein n=1 Tax=Luteithermobacter gelatinilyticus TaxID=2582913 RepID=UPI001106316C|nr:gluconate 2-dehydrogenase subunit 3 family protein [Luteithermobacter gelatinilyticus]
MSLNRRSFHKRVAGGLLSCFIGGKTVLLTPAEATQKKIPFRILTPGEGRLLSLLGDALVPGAREAGLAHYVDHQLSDTTERNMLMLRYLGVRPPFTDFYRSALGAVAQSLEQAAGRPMDAVFENPPAEKELEDYIARLSRENPPGWDKMENAPPAPFFYFVLRADALDVTYGTREGFERLDIPYLAHIEPQRRSWS